MFAVMRLHKWSSLQAPGGLEVRLAEKDCTGFMPVFTTREAAIECAGGEQYVREVKVAAVTEGAKT